MFQKLPMCGTNLRKTFVSRAGVIKWMADACARSEVVQVPLTPKVSRVQDFLTMSHSIIVTLRGFIVTVQGLIVTLLKA